MKMLNTAFIFFVKVVLVLAISMLMITSCSEKPEVNNIVEYPEEEDDDDDDYYDIDICGRSDGYSRRECQTPEFYYEVTHNYEKGESSRSRSDDDQYIAFWALPGKTFIWKASLIPEDSHSQSRHVRFIINEDQLPPVIKPRRSSRRSKEVSFEVNLEDPIEDEDGVDIDPEDWLEEEDQAEGLIEIEIQDVSYCYLQNRINRDSSASQVDCNDPDISASNYRSQILEIPYHLNYDKNLNDIVCSSVKAASSFTGDIIGAILESAGRIAATIITGSESARCLQDQDRRDRDRDRR